MSRVAERVLAEAIARASAPSDAELVAGAHERVAAPLDDPDWSTLRDDATTHRVTGALLRLIDDERLPTTDEQREQVIARHVGAMSTAVRLDRQLARVAGLLHDAGMDVIALKGPAVAHLDYAEPSHRAYGDIDVLLRAADIDRAFALLAEDGYRRPAARLRADFDRRFGKGATFVGRDGLELDVHRMFAFGAFGLMIDPDDLFADTQPFVVADTTVDALGSHVRYLHACYHAALGSPRPRWSTLQDVVQLHPRAAEDAHAAAATARSWGGLVVLRRAHRLVSQQIGVRLTGPVVDAALRHEPTRRERLVMDTYVGARRSFAYQVLAALPALPTWRDRLSFVAAVSAPAEESIQSRGTTGRLAWLRRGLRSLREGAAS